VHGLNANGLQAHLAEQHAWIFCGHADAAVGGYSSLAFVRSGQIDTILASTIVQIVRQHTGKLGLVVLNGCHSLTLGAELVEAGVDKVICWDSLVADEAAIWFSLGFARKLAASDDVLVAFDAAVASVLSVTEPGVLDSGRRGWVQKYELGDPETDVAASKLKRGRRDDRNGGRVVAGLHAVRDGLRLVAL